MSPSELTRECPLLLVDVVCMCPRFGLGMQEGRSGAEADRNPPAQTARPGPRVKRPAAKDDLLTAVASLAPPFGGWFSGGAPAGPAVGATSVSARDRPVAPARSEVSAPPLSGRPGSTPRVAGPVDTTALHRPRSNPAAPPALPPSSKLRPGSGAGLDARRADWPPGAQIAG